MAAIDLAYEEYGKCYPPTLLILHGFFASSRNWRLISEKLSTNLKFHVVALDMRNHGLSPHHAVMDYPAMAADIVKFMDDHSLTRAHVMGHSMGGKIAMWLALNQPERINKLIVVDIAPKNYTHSFEKVINALINLPLAKLDSRKQADTLLADAIPQLEYRQFLLQNLVLNNGNYAWRVDLPIFLQAAPNIAGFPDTQYLKPYNGDTLFIAGEKSGYVVPTDTCQLFPSAGFISILESGHWPHVEKPQVFVQQVESFLQRGG